MKFDLELALKGAPVICNGIDVINIQLIEWAVLRPVIFRTRDSKEIQACDKNGMHYDKEILRMAPIIDTPGKNYYIGDTVIDGFRNEKYAISIENWKTVRIAYESGILKFPKMARMYRCKVSKEIKVAEWFIDQVMLTSHDFDWIGEAVEVFE